MFRRSMSPAVFAVAMCCSFATIRADDATPTADALLPAKSRWAGTEEADETHAHSRSIAAHLTVSERDGTKFVAEFWVARDAGVRVKGTVLPDGQVNCVPTEVLKGKWNRNVLEAHWHGKATAEQVVLTRPVEGGGERTTTLTPADEDAGKHAKK